MKKNNKKDEIDNPCVVCNEKEEIDSGMCKKCYGEAVNYLELAFSWHP